MLSACALAPRLAAMPPDSQVQTPGEYFAAAIEASPERREALWRSAQAGERTPETRLRNALMQSLPGHPGHDPDAASRDLKKLAGKDAPPEIAALARIRLAGLGTENVCQGEVLALKKRVAQIADIERQLDRNGK